MQSHDDIAHTAMQNKLKHSKSSDHECSTATAVARFRWPLATHKGSSVLEGESKILLATGNI